MTIEEAQEDFKQQSIAITGHKNIVLNSDYWSIFRGPQLIYKKIKTRSDWFIVRCETYGDGYSHDDDVVKEIKIIKVILNKPLEFTVKRVWDDYSRIINLIDPNSDWRTSQCFLMKSLPENEIIYLLENTIFSQYIEDNDPDSDKYQTIQLSTR